MNFETVKIEVLGTPFTKQSVKTRAFVSKSGKAFAHHYQPKKIIGSENTFRAVVISQLPKNFVPFAGAVEVLYADFYFPPLKSFTKKKLLEVENGIVPKITKPDLTDNLMKGVFDAMEGIVFNNDSQIWRTELTSKTYSLTPRTVIMLKGER